MDGIGRRCGILVHRYTSPTFHACAVSDRRISVLQADSPPDFLRVLLTPPAAIISDIDSRRTTAHTTMSEWLGRIYSGRHHVRRTDTPADNHPASNRCNVEAADKLLDVSEMM